MNNNYKLKTLGAGSKFEYGGISWVLLQKTKTAALCLAEKILFSKAFDEDGNNWAEASLRKHLNGEFIEQLAAAGAEKAAFLPFTVDLTADDGLKDYSKVTDRISLITCELYRKHRYIIPNAADWWWTVTAYSTASNGYSRVVRCVGASGALNGGSANYGSNGVRPLCNLNSSIVVSATEVRDYTPEEEQKTETAEQPPKPATEKQDSTRTLHKKAIKRAYEVLDKAQQNYLENGDPAIIGQIATALTTLQAVTQIELTDEEKAELRDLHAEVMKQSYKCVQLSFYLYIEQADKTYPDKATEALLTLQAILGING